MIIPLQFGLWHSGCKLSYLRYLTFKTLRHFHPDSKIQLYVATECRKDGYVWRDEKQDFENDEFEKDYLDLLKELNIEVIKTNMFGLYQPTFQSDFFRWWYLKNEGGWYLDTDQIVLRSFNTLPLENNLICSIYQAQSCGIYSPVGCMGASKDSEVVDWISKLLPQFYEPNNYNSLGPFMFRSVIRMRKWEDKIFNAPSVYFYPIPDSFMVGRIYNGDLKIVNDNFAIHWYGGHPLSQEFNKKYTEEFAKTSNDTISNFLRNEKII